MNKHNLMSLAFGALIMLIIVNLVYLREQQKKYEITLSFKCPADTKVVIWTMVLSEDYAGEIYKRCQR